MAALPSESPLLRPVLVCLSSVPHPLLLGAVLSLTLFSTSARAQAVDDAVLLAPRELVAGSVYVRDTWTDYWEGTLKRDNGNIGTVTTTTSASFVNYGVTERLTVLGTLPHVWTTASQGVLHGMRGFQDLQLAAKYRLVQRPTGIGQIRALAVAQAGLPLTSYTSDFYPLSIGSGSRRVGGRLTVQVEPATGWSASGSAAYTVRGGVTLDRPYYYTDDQLFLTDHVDMPNVADGTANVGYARGGWLASAAFTQQWTLGGGDIRRHDMPFISNRMNASRLGGLLMAPVPGVSRLAVQLGYSRTLTGRNVGQSSVLTTGLVLRVREGQRTIR